MLLQCYLQQQHACCGHPVWWAVVATSCSCKCTPGSAGVYAYWFLLSSWLLCRGLILLNIMTCIMGTNWVVLKNSNEAFDPVRSAEHTVSSSSTVSCTVSSAGVSKGCVSTLAAESSAINGQVVWQHQKQQLCQEPGWRRLASAQQYHGEQVYDIERHSTTTQTLAPVSANHLPLTCCCCSYVLLLCSFSTTLQVVFTSLRFTLAAAAFTPFIRKGLSNPMVRKAGMEIGMWTALGYLAQSWALSMTPASRASLLSTFTVIAVPCLAGLSGQKVKPLVWACGLAALVGTTLLEQGGGEPPNAGALV
jgi:hypothetical protein